MKVYCEQIAWGDSDGVDITGLPQAVVIDISQYEVDDQESFYDACYAELQERFNVPICGLHYIIMEGMLH
jgi:hypothetical protein